MIKVGVTGGIGSGKSLICRVFAELGVPVYDSDMRAKSLMSSDAGIIGLIKELLGEESYPAGRLDRPYVASRIFSDKELLLQMNSIVHPAVADDFGWWAQLQAADGAPYVIFESAILIESGLSAIVDTTITISAPDHIRIERVSGRDRTNREDIKARIANQMSDSQREAMADHMIVNDGQMLVIPQVVALDKIFRNDGR